MNVFVSGLFLLALSFAHASAASSLRLLQTLNSSNSGLQQNIIHSFAADGSGGFWLGTGTNFNSVENGGLEHYNGKSFDLYLSEPDLISPWVNEVLPDNRGGVWIALLRYTTGGGLMHRDAQGQLKQISIPGRTSDFSGIWSMISDGAGGAWFSDYDYLHHINADQQITTYTGIGGSKLYFGEEQGLVRDNNNIIWGAARSTGGLYRLNPAIETEASTQDKGVLTFITALAVDSNNGLWAADRDGHLSYRSSDGTWQTYSSGLGSVNDLAFDGQGRLWIASPQGLYIYNHQAASWQHFTQSNSELPTDSIYRVWPQDTNQAYLSSTPDRTNPLAPKAQGLMLVQFEGAATNAMCVRNDVSTPAIVDSAFKLYLPQAIYDGSLKLWARLAREDRGDGILRFQVEHYGTNTCANPGETDCVANSSTVPVTIDSSLNIFIPQVLYNGTPLWASLANEPASDGSLHFRLEQYGTNVCP